MLAYPRLKQRLAKSVEILLFLFVMRFQVVDRREGSTCRKADAQERAEHTGAGYTEVDVNE
jgi:hypothetical protein